MRNISVSIPLRYQQTALTSKPLKKFGDINPTLHSAKPILREESGGSSPGGWKILNGHEGSRQTLCLTKSGRNFGVMGDAHVRHLAYVIQINLRIFTGDDLPQKI